MVKSILSEKLSVSGNTFHFSASYLDLYDKLEKINTIYNRIAEDDLTMDFINKCVNQFLEVYGNFHYCKQLVNKYGLIFETDMPDSIYFDAIKMMDFLRAKIKSDAKILLCKKTKKDIIKKS